MTLEQRTFSGAIRHDESTYPLTFDVSAGDDGRLAIMPHAIETATLISLQSVIGEPGAYAVSVELKGESSDGATFDSDTIGIRGMTFGNPNEIKLEARKACIVLKCKEVAPAPIMRLWFRGFQGFRNVPVEMSLGTVDVSGQQKVKDADQISGCATLTAPSGVSISDWTEKADKFLTFMHRGLAFAHGGRLQTPRQDLLVGDRWEATFYAGGGFPKSLPPIPSLNQSPFINTLAKRYDDPKPFHDMLWTAVGWLHTGTTFADLSFMTVMTALETVVEHVIPPSLTTVVPKQEFAPVREKLFEVLAECELADDAYEIFKGKIKGLNSRTLSQKILALRDHYDFPPSIFSEKTILDIIKLRNSIVHTGESRRRREAWPKEIIVRELIALIMFHELGYDGEYNSYIDGYRLAKLSALRELSSE